MTSYLKSVDWDRIREAVIGRFAEGHGLILIFLVSTILIGVGVTYAQTRPRSVRGLWRHILPPGTVRHPSTKTDYLFWLSKRLTMPPLVLILGVSTAAAGHVAYSLLTRVFGPAQHPAQHAGFWVMCAFTACMLIVYDFGNYTFHRLQHRFPVLWELHKTHHSAQRMVGVTKDRVHPVEEILSRWWTGMISGPVYGIWLYFLVDPVELTVLGINAYALFNTVIMMDFVRHTHLKLSYGKWLNAIFLCPHYHQLHHSIEPRHYDRNFGQVLAIWDWMFGTLSVPKKDENFVFGLVGHEDEDYQSLWRIYTLPVVRAFRVARASLTGIELTTTASETSMQSPGLMSGLPPYPKGSSTGGRPGA